MAVPHQSQINVPSKMHAIRLHPAPSGTKPYSAANPAPSKALQFDSDVPIPQPTKSGEMLVRVRASTVIRDTLTWPEMYQEEYAIPGHDFAGTIVSVYDRDGSGLLKPGDEVYGMVDPNRGSMWAEYALVKAEEAALKPKSLSWEEAAAVPLSALTAWQALFDKAGIAEPVIGGAPAAPRAPTQGNCILITGATGGVGLYLVQLAVLAGLHVVAATSSTSRNSSSLMELGVNETIEYGALGQAVAIFDIIIDTVGGSVLKQSWSLVKGDGALVAVESASGDFVAEHRKSGVAAGKDGVKAVFFIVEPSRHDLGQISKALEVGVLKSSVAGTMPLSEGRAAYERCHDRSLGRGKLVLTV